MKFIKIIFIILIFTFLLFNQSSITFGIITCPDGSPCPDGTYCLYDDSKGFYLCPKKPPQIKIGDNYSIDNPVPQFDKISDIINKILPYAFTLAGILLFILLLASGFEFLTSGGDEKKLQQAKGRITAALVGFIIIVAAYWLTQIVEFLFHIQIF